MKYFWLLSLCLVVGCGNSTYHIPAVAPVVFREKVNPPDTFCISISHFMDEGYSSKQFIKILKKDRMDEAFALATRAWNLASQNHFIWKSFQEGSCPRHIAILLTLKKSSWKNLSKFYPVAPDDVGFTMLPQRRIFIRPDLLQGRFGFRSLVLVLTHEIGHAIGMPHVDDDNDIMANAFVFADLKQKVCLNGCIKIGDKTIFNLHKMYGVLGQEVIIF